MSKLPPSINRVVLSRFVSSTGAEAAFFVGLWGKAAFVFDGTPTDLAVLSFVVGVGAIVGSIAGGSLTDRLDPRRVALLAELAVVPTSIALVFAQDLTQLIIVGGLSWTAGAALEAAITSFPPVLLGDALLERANARLEAANWLALVVGPGIGALLSATLGLDTVFAFDAVTSVAAIALIVRLRLDPRRAGETDADARSSSGLRDAWLGLRYAARTPPVRLALYLQALTGSAFGVFIALEPLFFRDVLGVDIETVGLVNVVFGLGLFVGSMTLERSGGRFASFRANILFSMAAGAGAVVYSGTSSLTVVVIGSALWALPLGMSLPLSRTLAQRGTEPAFVGRVMGAFGVVTAAAGLLPVVAAPALAAIAGVQPVLVGSSAVALVGAPLAWRVARRLDDDAPALPGVVDVPA